MNKAGTSSYRSRGVHTFGIKDLKQPKTAPAKSIIRGSLPLAILAFLCSPTSDLRATPLTEAHVTKIINDVKLINPAGGARAAVLNDVVRDQIGLQTGIKSRSELQFVDNTLTRIGPETYFSFKAGTRDITLERGTMLLQVPKGLGGATIHAAAVTASITGTTILFEHHPAADIKVLVLEGTLRLSVNGRFGDSLLLTPGKMIIMKPDAKRIPDPVAVDLAKVTKTSSLVNMPGSKGKITPLPSLPLIEQAIAEQATEKSNAGLVNTNLVIRGSGTNVAIDQLLVLNDKAAAESSSATSSNTPTPSVAPSVAPSPTASPGSSATPTPTPHQIAFSKDGTISMPVSAANVEITAGHDLNIDALVTAQLGTFDAGHDINFNTTADVQALTLIAGHHLNYTVPLLTAAATGTLSITPGDGKTLTLHLSKLDLRNVGHGNGVVPITLNGGDAAFSSGFEGGNGGTLNIGTVSNPIAGDVTLNSNISATSGTNGGSVAAGGSGGNVSLTTNGQAKINSTIKVSDSAVGHASKSGGHIHIASNRTNGPAINVSSSAQLLALLSNAAPGPGGSIVFTSAGGDINMSGTAKADRGLIEITNTGANGKVTLANATLHGETVKAGALGNNGTLTIGGGTIDANTAIKLYAGGSNGQINFISNVTLSGNSVKTIAADAVTIFNGKVVTVLGNSPANVFTNHPNYTGFGGNGSKTGTFAGQGATTQPLSNSPSGY